MRVYLTGSFEYMDVRVGFGNAAHEIYKEFTKQGLDVHVKSLYSNEKYYADIEICFDQPQNYKFMSDGYKIGYTPWESSEFLPGWKEKMLKCDEIWTPSTWNQGIFKRLLPQKEVFVYTHGINPRYLPKKRKLDKSRPFTFLFIGTDGARKEGQMVVSSFIKLYGNNKDYRLILKGVDPTLNNIKVFNSNGTVEGEPSGLYDNILTINKSFTISEMIELYNQSDVFVYPTWGEGFGFNPLQAMAMGIPTISTYKWAEYKDLITVPINSVGAISPWQDIHPGFMLKPEFYELKKAMSIARTDYNEWSEVAFRNSFEVHERFSWENVTKPAIARLEKIYQNL